MAAATRRIDTTLSTLVNNAIDPNNYDESNVIVDVLLQRKYEIKSRVDGREDLVMVEEGETARDLKCSIQIPIEDFGVPIFLADFLDFNIRKSLNLGEKKLCRRYLALIIAEFAYNHVHNTTGGGRDPTGFRMSAKVALVDEFVYQGEPWEIGLVLDSCRRCLFSRRRGATKAVLNKLKNKFSLNMDQDQDQDQGQGEFSSGAWGGLFGRFFDSLRRRAYTVSVS